MTRKILAVVCTFVVLCSTLVCVAGQYEFKVEHNGVVTYDYPDPTVGATGLVRLKNGDLLTTFTNTGDLMPLSSIYTSRSKDEGMTWSYADEREKSVDPKCGICDTLFTLPDGALLRASLVAWHSRVPKNQYDQLKNCLREYITYAMEVSQDDGETFTPVDFPEGKLHFAVQAHASSRLLKLSNGDLLMPFYRDGDLSGAGHVCGSGFLRSTDGGYTWGSLEIAFSQQAGGPYISECAFVEKEPGVIYGYARSDLDMKHVPLWRVKSTDYGKTWSKPEPIPEISGICPCIIRLENGLDILSVGVRNDPVRTQLIHFFVIEQDGSLTDVGVPYYTHPFDNGKPEPNYGGTGGVYSMLPLSGDRFVIVFMAGDPTRKMDICSYTDCNVISVRRKAADAESPAK